MKYSVENLLKSLAKTTNKSLGIRNKQEIDFLLEVTSTIRTVAMDTHESDHFVSQITEGKLKSYRNANRKESSCLRLALRGYLLDRVFHECWHELGTAIRSLIVGNYTNISRPLRWILEAIIIWAEFQIEQPSSRTVYNNYNKLSLNQKEYLYNFNVMGHTSRTILQQRVLLKEKYDRPTFKELINNLSNLRQFDSKKGIFRWDNFQNDIKVMYDEMSSLIHISKMSLKELMLDDVIYVDKDYFVEYEYDKEQFCYFLSKIWKIIDLVLSLVVLVNLKFHEYDTPIEFVNSMTNGIKRFDSDMDYLIHLLRKHKKTKLSYFVSLIDQS